LKALLSFQAQLLAGELILSSISDAAEKWQDRISNKNFFCIRIDLQHERVSMTAKAIALLAWFRHDTIDRFWRSLFFSYYPAIA